MNAGNRRIGNAALNQDIKFTINNILTQFPAIHGTIIIAQGKEILWHKGFSYQEAPILTDKNGQYLIASITKTFTAVALLSAILEDHNKRNVTTFKKITAKEALIETLEQHLSHFLPASHPIWQDDMPVWATQVTLHHLLTHTSGIKDIHGPLAHPPGTTYVYSNSGYVLLGHVIETLVNQPVDVYYQRAIFQPAQMYDTFLPLTGTPTTLKKEKRFKKLALGFESHKGTIQTITNKPFFSDLFTAGGIISTALDLIKWNHALHSGNIIPLFAVDLMITPYGLKKGFPFYNGVEELSYGYGIDMAYSDSIYQHCGGTTGYQSKISYISNTGITIVNLSNFAEEASPIFSFANKLRECLV